MFGATGLHCIGSSFISQMADCSIAFSSSSSDVHLGEKCSFLHIMNSFMASRILLALTSQNTLAVDGQGHNNYRFSVHAQACYVRSTGKSCTGLACISCLPCNSISY